jgi:hypothetical protein
LPGLPKFEPFKLPEYVIEVKNLRGIVLAGSGEVRIDGIDAKHLSISVTGAGILIAMGTAETLDLSVVGAARFDGQRLQTDTARVEHSGTGAARLHVRKLLDVTLNGFGSVEYLGDPEVRQAIVGFGRVTPLRE